MRVPYSSGFVQPSGIARLKRKVLITMLPDAGRLNLAKYLATARNLQNMQNVKEKLPLVSKGSCSRRLLLLSHMR